MKRNFLIVLFSCTSLIAQKTASDYANSITEQELKELLYVYASDYFAGRETGTKGQKIAVDFLREYYKAQNIAAAEGTTDYFQPMNLSIRGKEVATENVAAIIPGSEFPNEYLVISSHLDHIGVRNGQVNNGADDDGSGTVSMLEIAEAFQQAVADGNGPRRSIVFLHVSGEEKGLLGSKYYTDQEPLYPLAQTVANLNIDMIGRLDPKREDKDPKYIYLIGSDKLSTELHEISEAVNQATVNLKLDYTYNDEKDPNRFYYRSDHYNFAKNNIPIIFYFNGTHDDYHRPSDTPDKINYDMLKLRTELVFHTAWELANRDARIVVDKKSE